MVNYTARWVSAAPRADCFAFDAVFLVGEGEGDMVCTREDGNGDVRGSEDVAIASEGGLADTEGGGLFVCACVTVFTWLHEEVETDPDDVNNALPFSISTDVMFEDFVQDGSW